LRLYKYVFIAVLALIACGLIASATTACITRNPALPVAAALVGLAALAALSLAIWAASVSLNRILQLLKNKQAEKIKTETLTFMPPLVDALKEFVADCNEKIQNLEKQNDDIQLQYQLLKRQKQNTEAIIYSIRDAVIVSDAFNRIVIANNAAESLFQFKLDPEDPKTIKDLIQQTEFVELVLHSIQNQQQHVRHELTFETDSEPKTFDCIISCVKDDREELSGVVAVLHDITREKEISNTKSDFVSHVSHELKTPLASINAYAEMLVDGEAEDTETINQFCSIIQSQAQRLNRLIEDILNISRIESGMTKINKQSLSVAILISDAVKMIKSYAQEKSIEVITEAEIIHDQVFADKDMITQVIVNLLSNAVKYTPEKGTISVHTDVDDADCVVRVTVTDTGVGIPEKDIDHVFDKFYRVDANKKYAKGTGLGLNLVKQIVEKVHGGRVFLTSKINEGSTFGFELPLAVQNTMQTT
jgi:two-component system phosphate regulon sensor histidine kinase PhoR